MNKSKFILVCTVALLTFCIASQNSFAQFTGGPFTGKGVSSLFKPATPGKGGKPGANGVFSALDLENLDPEELAAIIAEQSKKIRNWRKSS